MDFDKIVEKMQKGIVLLEYTSLISGNEKQREMTLCPAFIPDGKRIVNSQKWKQDQNDKMICYDLEFGKWDDIDKDTILSWKVVEREKNFKKVMRSMTDLNHDGEIDND